MHILLINHYAGNPEMGMEFRPYYMATEWCKQNHKVTIVAASNSHVRQKQPPVNSPYDIQNIDGIDYIWIKTPPYDENNINRIWNILTFLRGLYTYKRWLKLKVDVVISSSTYTLDIFPARKIALANKAKLIYEVHDLWPLSPIELGGYSKYHPFIYLVQLAENYAYKYSDQVVSMLPNALEYMQGHGLNRKKYHHIPNGIKISEWNDIKVSHGSQILVDELQSYKKKGFLTIGYAGSIGLANALDALVRAADMLRDHKIKFVVIGKGPEKESLLHLSEQLNLTNISFYEPVPKDQLPAILEVLDILYIGLQHQSLFRFGISPNKLIDYMMAAKPVVQAIKAGNDMVSEAQCGITVEPENPDAIARAILELQKMNKSQLQKLGENGKKYVIENHDYQILAEKFLQIIKKSD